LLASSAGKGFFVNSNDLIASTKSGRKVMNLKPQDRSVSCFDKIGDSIAVFSGEKKSVKLLIFKHSEIPFLQKGRGVKLQKFKSGKTYSAFCIDMNKGLKHSKSSKLLLNPKELKKWFGKRAQAGKIEPKNLHTKI
jgi:topoisomerase-4 subunit A